MTDLLAAHLFVDSLLARHLADLLAAQNLTNLLAASHRAHHYRIKKLVSGSWYCPNVYDYNAIPYTLCQSLHLLDGVLYILKFYLHQKELYQIYVVVGRWCPRLRGVPRYRDNIINHYILWTHSELCQCVVEG